jgi:hypothetical protein
MTARFAVPVLVAILSACASGPPADFDVPLTSPGGDAYRLLIYDGSGLVTAARSNQCFPDCRTDEVLALPERLELEIGWTGGACHHQPTLEVAGDSAHLRVDVRNPADPNWVPFLPIGCPAVGVPLRVTLSLAEPVEGIVIDLEVHYE